MTPAFQVKEFLTLIGNENGKFIVKKKIRKVSTKTQFVTKFCCRQENLKELLSFHNVATRAVSNSNSYTKIIGLSGEGGIGKSRLVSEFVRNISSGKSINVIKINYSDKNNLIFQNEFENIRDIFESRIKTINKSKAPAIVILEDLHWYEAEEKKKIEKLLFAFSGELPIPFNLSVMFVATYRLTNSQYNFLKFDSFEEIALKQFTDEESNEFINHSSIVKNRKLSKEIREKVISLSAGIPFYIEEFLKSLTIENGKEIIPDTIERLLSYKLSFIHVEVLKVLQIIAAWDGSLNEESLINICHKLRLIIHTQKILLQTGILRIESKNGEVSYSFTHDIYKNYITGITDTYFAIIINKTIAGIFEKSHSKSEHVLFKLYHHYKNCNESDKAYEYLENYIDKIVEQREFESALQRIDELIEYHAANEKKKLEIWLLKIKCLRELLKRDQMGIELIEVEKIIGKYKTSELSLKYLYQLEEYFLLSNDFTRAFRVINKGLKLSKLQKNLYMEAEFQFLLTRNLNTTGKVNECLKQTEKLLKISAALQIRKFYYWGSYFKAVNFISLRNFELANSIIDKCIFETKRERQYSFLNTFYKAKAKYYYENGELDKFIFFSREHYRLDLNIADCHSSIVTLLNISNCLIQKNLVTEAKEILDNVLQFSQKTNSIIFQKRIFEALFNLNIFIESYYDAEKISFQLLELYDKNDLENICLLNLNLISVYYFINNLRRSYECFKLSINYANKINNIAYKATAFYNMGYSYFLIGETENALKYLQKSYFIGCKYLRNNFSHEICATLAEAYLSTGKITQCKRILGKINTSIKITKDIKYEIFFNLFGTLVWKLNCSEEFKCFLSSHTFLDFIADSKIDNMMKIKIIYYILLLLELRKVRLKSKKLNSLKKKIPSNKNKNKLMEYYVSQIKKQFIQLTNS